MAECEVGSAEAVVQPRAYQLELFDASMEKNIIVTVREIHCFAMLSCVLCVSFLMADVVHRWTLGVARPMCKFPHGHRQNIHYLFGRPFPKGRMLANSWSGGLQSQAAHRSRVGAVSFREGEAGSRNCQLGVLSSRSPSWCGF
jgi:hypothetical protein